MNKIVYYINNDIVKKGEIEKVTIRYGNGVYDKESLESPYIDLFDTEEQAKDKLKEKLQVQIDTLHKRLERVL